MNKRLAFYMPPHKHIKSYYDMIDCAVDMGVTKIEGFAFFEFETPDIDEAKKIKEYADSKNITFPCFSVYNCLTHSGVQKSCEKLKKYADVAKILGSPYLHHTLVAEFKYPERVLPQKDELLEKGINLAKEVSAYAESIGIKAVYEEQGYIFNGIKNMDILVHELGDEPCVVTDFGNIFQSGENITDFIKYFIDKTVHVHVKDLVINDDDSGLKTLDGKYTHSTEPMTGDVDVLKNISLLEELGYKGDYAIEFGNDEEDTKAIERVLKAIDDLLTK